MSDKKGFEFNFSNSSPVATYSRDDIHGLKDKLLNVSNISSCSVGLTKRAPSLVSKKASCANASFRNRKKVNSKVGRSPKSFKVGTGNKENIAISDTSMSPVSSVISEGIADQMARVIHTGAWDHVLMASETSSNSPSPSFLSIVREMGLEMSTLNLDSGIRKTLQAVMTNGGATLAGDDCERHRRMQCERVIEELHGKLLQVQQDLAVAMANNHENEKKVKGLNQLLDRVGESWRKMEEDSKVNVMEKEALSIRFQSVSKECGELKEKVRDLVLNVEELVKKGHQAKKEHETQVTEWEEQVEHLRNELTQHKEMARILQEELTSVQVSLQKLKKEKADKEDEVTRLQRESATTSSRLQDLKVERDSLKEQVALLSTRLQQAEEQLQETQREKEGLEAELRKQGADAALRELECQVDFKQQIAKVNGDWEERIRELQESQQTELKRREMLSGEQHQKELGLLREQLTATSQKLEMTSYEMETWKKRTEKLQIGRSHILSKLQTHLQEQWSEAVRLLYESPEQDDAPNTSVTLERQCYREVVQTSSDRRSLDPIFPGASQNNSPPKSTSSSGDQGYSPLQHYIHLLLKRPVGQQSGSSSASVFFPSSSIGSKDEANSRLSNKDCPPS